MYRAETFQAGKPTTDALNPNVLPELPTPEDCALRGLIFAVPMSLALWVILGLAVWGIVR